MKSTLSVNHTTISVAKTMDNLFIVTFQDKTYLVRNSDCREKAYDKVHDFLGGRINSFETDVREVVFPPENDASCDVAQITR